MDSPGSLEQWVKMLELLIRGKILRFLLILRRMLITSGLEATRSIPFRSTDSGETWEQESIRISPVEVISSVFPQTDAGDPGRIAVTYLGSENAELLNESNIDGNPWDGNAHYAPNNVTYHLYITYSLNALDPEPTFHTYRVTDDPVQVGSICLNSGDCRDIGVSNRNVLDFNDLHIDREGRVYVAFADGCTGDCASSNNSSAQDSRDGRGSVYYLAQG